MSPKREGEKYEKYLRAWDRVNVVWDALGEQGLTVSEGNKHPDYLAALEVRDKAEAEWKGILTVEEVIRRVGRIKMVMYDNEAAHDREDCLYADVLRAIAEGTDNAQDLARLALLTKKLDFPRWYG